MLNQEPLWAVYTKFVSFLKWFKDPPEDCEIDFEQLEVAEQRTLTGILETILLKTLNWPFINLAVTL